MRRSIITLIAVAFLLPLTLSAQPGPGPEPGRPMGHGMMLGEGAPMPDRHNHMERGMGGGCEGEGGPGIAQMMKMADELGLTDQQREQLKKMQTEFKLQMIDRRAAVEKAEVMLRSTMMDDKSTEAEVGRLIDQVAGMRADVQKLRYSHHKQMKGVLTAEQVKKFGELRKDCMGKGGAGCMGMGMGMGHAGCMGKGAGGDDKGEKEDKD